MFHFVGYAYLAAFGCIFLLVVISIDVFIYIKAPMLTVNYTVRFSNHSYFNVSGTKRTCNLEYLRDSVLRYETFPHYNSCIWSEAKVDFKSCLKKRGIKKVVIIGDSNGLRFFGAFKKKVAQAGGKCKTVAKEKSHNNEPDKSYFCRSPGCKARTGNKLENIVTHPKECVGCTSQIHVCSGSQMNIVVEYISVEFLLDTSLTTYFTPKKSIGGPEAALKQCCPFRRSHSFQEYLLKEYFVETGYPDLVLWFTSSHDKPAFTADEIENAAHNLGALMALHAPINTTFILFGKVYEEMDLKPKTWTRLHFEGNFTTLEQIQRMNSATARGMRDEFSKKENNIYPFFDLFSYGEEHAKEWGKDGVHKKPVFYESVMSYLFRGMCLFDMPQFFEKST